MNVSQVSQLILNHCQLLVATSSELAEYRASGIQTGTRRPDTYIPFSPGVSRFLEFLDFPESRPLDIHVYTRLSQQVCVSRYLVGTDCEF